MEVQNRSTRQFIGCATDSKYTMPTCAMLSSLDDNGDVPDAVVLVADFGLSASDRWLIRRSAGRLGHSMRFIPIDQNHPRIIIPNFECPLPLLGRFILPLEISEPRARLILLDSDMIVNASLRPLYDRFMEGHTIAAVHDALAVREHWGRPANLNYLNAGMMMIDVDRFREQDLGRRALQRLSDYRERPRFLDQDAINDLLDGGWLRLDRTWNFYHAADPVSFTLADYEGCKIAHFCGAKPWEISHHPATPLYARHAENVLLKTRYHYPEGPAGLNREFAAACYEVFLDRDLDDVWIFEDRAHFNRSGFVASVVNSDEFQGRVMAPLLNGGELIGYDGRPSVRQKYWIMDWLPICDFTAPRIESASSWRQTMQALAEDYYFMDACGLKPLQHRQS